MAKRHKTLMRRKKNENQKKLSIFHSESFESVKGSKGGLIDEIYYFLMSFDVFREVCVTLHLVCTIFENLSIFNFFRFFIRRPQMETGENEMSLLFFKLW